MQLEDLSIKEILVLKSLEKEPKVATRIAEELNIPPTTIYNILYRLQAEDLVRKENNRKWIITEQGKKILKKVIEVIG